METFINAIRENNINYLKNYINNNGNDILFEVNNRNMTPLEFAIPLGNFDIIKYLVDQGSDVKIHEIDDPDENFFFSPLSPILAASANITKNPKNFLRIIIYLVENGADLNAGNIDGPTAIEVLNDNLLEILGYDPVNDDISDYELDYIDTLVIHNIDDIKRIYKKIVHKPWKKAVRKVNRIVNGNRKILEDLELPKNVSKGNLPPNIIGQISRMTVFGKKNNKRLLKTINAQIKYLNTI